MRYPEFSLDGAVVAITGGGRGIGRETALRFAARGATVALGDLDLAAAAAVAEEIGSAASAHELDVTSSDSFASFLEAVTRSAGPLDVLVNNAGLARLGPFLDEPEAASRAMLEVNVWGVLLGTRLALPGMIERGHGHVVNVASMAGKLAIPGGATYCASKYAVVGLSETVREELELGDAPVSLTTILPTAVRTRLSSGVGLGGGLPVIDPEQVADAIIASCETRAAEMPVPGWLRVYEPGTALIPRSVMKLARRLIGSDRALKDRDDAERAAYDETIVSQGRSALERS